MIQLLALFFISGFCSLVYEIVWLRLAMGVFGVTAPYVSIFLSVFMAGLGLGSWGAGRLCKRLESAPASYALRLYATAEALIALSALAVPRLLASSRMLLAGDLAGAAWGSAGYYWASGACTALILLPWCACMGATFPLAMAAIGKRSAEKSANSFSALYAANVVGAGLGTLASAFILIEILGFRGTLGFSAWLNVAIAAVALSASFRPELNAKAVKAAPTPARAAPSAGSDVLPYLFLSGLLSMAMEVVWTRQFTPYLGNSVYAFALILSAYLLASFAGSCLYRTVVRANASQYHGAWMISGALSLLPVIAANPYLTLNAYVRIAMGLSPFCALLGFLTPSLIDRWSEGNPGRAGTAYAVNIIGCILGPLIAGFLLLPRMEERSALMLLSAPLFLAGLRAVLRQPATGRLRAGTLYGAASGLAALLAFSSYSIDDGMMRLDKNVRLKRDYQADVSASGEGATRVLKVNTIGMTTLTPITKLMAHLPLAFLSRPPENALVICFGMGTTFRSLVSWGIRATAVELVPSVPELFGYFHEDAAKVLAAPNARVVIDDGRRFLERSTERFDVITLDPAPPMSAAGASFLFSEEFYSAAKERLSPDGIVQQWFLYPLEPIVLSAFAKALKNSFPYVRVFRSLEGWGYHCLASRKPIPSYSAAQLAARMPKAAVRDLVEMGPYGTGLEQLRAQLKAEVSIDELILPGGEGLRDDRPINEYSFLRRKFARRQTATESGSSR